MRRFGQILSQLQWSLFSPRVTAAWGELVFAILGRRRTAGGAHRILVVRLDDLGDLVLCSGFLRELRRTFPAARITLLVKPRFRAFAERCPHVDEVLTFDPATCGRLGPAYLYLRALRLALLRLWPRRFDLAVNPRRDVDYYYANHLAYLSGAPVRVGYAVGGTCGSARLLNRTFPDTPGFHEVLQNLGLIKQLGGVVRDDSLEPWAGPGDRAAADALLSARGVGPGEPLLAIAPGAANAHRVWPADRFRETAERVHRGAGVRAVLVGGPADVAAAAVIANGAGARVIDLTGQTNIPQTAAMVSRCRVFLGNDSGPMHLAAAAGVPVIEVSSFPRGGPAAHPNSPARFGPWRVPAVVLQPAAPLAPCRDGCQAETAHCITQVTAADAGAAVLHLLFGH